MSLNGFAGLITAVFELKAVQAVTRAINANLPKDGPLGTIRPSSAQLQPRPRQYYSQTPEARIEPRQVVQPTPTFAVARDYYDPCCRDVPVPTKASEPSEPWTMEGPSRRTGTGPVDPPWKHLPPPVTCAAELKVNLIRPQVDLITKGMLLDVFA